MRAFRNGWLLLFVVLVLFSTSCLLFESRGHEKIGDSVSPHSSNDQEAGRAVYLKACLVCHGEKGGLIAKADLSLPAFWEGRDPAGVADIVAKGIGEMPPMVEGRGGILTSREIVDVVYSLRALAQAQEHLEPADEFATARYYYSRYCANCHGSLGIAVRGVNLTSPEYLAARGDEALSQTIASGGIRMPAFSQVVGGPMSDSQILAMVDYLKAWSAEGRPPVEPRKREVKVTPTPGPVVPAAPKVHSQVWVRQHPTEVLQKGAGLCYRCHATSFCVACHGRSSR